MERLGYGQYIYVEDKVMDGVNKMPVFKFGSTARTRDTSRTLKMQANTVYVYCYDHVGVLECMEVFE